MSEWNARVVEWYAAKYGEYPTNRLAADAIDVTPDAVVVDVGCGTGSALRRLASRVPNGRLIGVDPTARMLEIARERSVNDPNGHRIEFREGPAERLPVDDACADLVLAFDSIDHWKDRRAGLLEVRRVLRPDGRVAVVKDGGLPGDSELRRGLYSQLEGAGLRVVSEHRLTEDEISCTLWVIEPA